MLQVHLANVSLTNYGFVMFLKSEGYKEVLPIFIGMYEAQAILMEFNKEEIPRPVTHDLIKNILQTLSCKINKIVINDLKDNVFYAIIELEREGEKYLIDSRPSDAVALAVRFSSPIYVEEAVMEKAAVELPIDENPDFEKSVIDKLNRELERAIAEERYEDAARIRDEIKKHKGEHN